MPDLSESWLSYREEHTDTLLSMIANHADEDTLRAYLIGWWVRRDGTSAETSQSWRLARNEFVRMLENISATLTDSQRARVVKRLRAIRDDLAPYRSDPRQQTDLQVVQACASPAA
jgi:hypothetical protein